jgi:nickel-dependent lactate racemase
MDQVKKTKIRNIVSKYKNKSSSDLSKDFSYESKLNNTINSSRPSNLHDKKQELKLIKEESE